MSLMPYDNQDPYTDPDRSVVPCAGCTLCCQNDAIFIHPELGDDASQYKTQKYHGLDIIKHLANGQCYYLNRKFGCTIHERAPAICRAFDCRGLLKALRRKGIPENEMVRRGLIGRDVLAQAKRLMAKGNRP